MVVKVTVGLALYQLCVTDLSGLSTYRINGLVRKMSISLRSVKGLVDLTLALPLTDQARHNSRKHDRLKTV